MALQPPDHDHEVDGLHSELKHVKLNEDRFHNEINFAFDQVAYGHSSALYLSDKLVTNPGEGS